MPCVQPAVRQSEPVACLRSLYTCRTSEGKSPEVVALYRHLEALIQCLGPVIVTPEKTRIAFQVRMSFAAVMLKRQWIDGHLVLARRLESPRFRRVETISPRNHVHSFRLTCVEEMDMERVVNLYNRKYHWDLDPYHLPGPFYAVRSEVAFGWLSDETGLDRGSAFHGTATRWQF